MPVVCEGMWLQHVDKQSLRLGLVCGHMLLTRIFEAKYGKFAAFDISRINIFSCFATGSAREEATDFDIFGLR